MGAESDRRAGRLGPLAAAIILGCCWGSLPLVAQVPTSQEKAEADEEQGGLALVNVDLLDSRDGYAIPWETTFQPGDTIHVYLQVAGFALGEFERVKLEYRLRARDPSGEQFFPAEAGAIDVELAPQDEDWRPVVRYSPSIPWHAGAGRYSIEVEVRDDLAGTSLTEEFSVQVEGTRFEAADSLLVAEFRFCAVGADCLAREPVFRRGEQIRAEFFISGYETRDDNTFQVASDAWVLDDLGKRIYDFERVSERGAPFYPRLWLPAKLSLDLDGGIPPGPYTVVVRVRDAVGGAEITERYGFRVL